MSSRTPFVRDLLILERGFHPLSSFSPKGLFYCVIPRASARGISAVKSKRLKTRSNFPQKRLKIFWVELEEGTFPSSINRHVERSETSPQLCFLGSLGGIFSPPQLKGGDPSERHFGVTTYGRGKKTPSQPIRSVVLSEAKDLRLFPKKDLLLCHLERSERSPPLCFSGSLKGDLSHSSTEI